MRELGTPPCERVLFHGTGSDEVAEKILHRGVDFRFYGANQTLYGKGSYFALKARYSHGYTTPRLRRMFVCRVLCGRSAVGDNSYCCPPVRSKQPNDTFDSCVDRIADPEMYIIFDNCQCYVEYAIEYVDVVSQ